MSDGEPLPVARSWPPGRELTDAESLATACQDCGQSWRVHTSLAGFRLRCGCGAFVAVPALPVAAAPSRLSAPAVDPTHRIDTRVRDERGQILLPGDLGETVFAPIATHLPMAPGSLRRASPSNQVRWTNRTLLEFFAMLCALGGPQLAAFWLASGREFELLLPFASLASGVLVALVVAWAGHYGRVGFARASARHYGEALLAAGLGVLLAFGWVELVRTAFDHDEDMLQQLTTRLGIPLALFVVAVTPAVLEEVMFRGVLQGRLTALLGTRVGLVATAAAFALCHGAPAVLPIHMGLGLYLGWLRERSGSLLPGMLMHFAYNGTIVVLGIG